MRRNTTKTSIIQIMVIKKTKTATVIQMKAVITVNNRGIKGIISQIKEIKATITYINRRAVIKYKAISMVILKKKTFLSIANRRFSIIPKKMRINFMKISKNRMDLKLK